MYTQEDIYAQTSAAVRELLDLDRADFDPVRVLVVGCSSSEIAGGAIGHDSTYEYGQAVAQAVVDICRARGVTAAFQCCEHLNRALVIEREAAERMGLEIVRAVPRKKAGGSLATAAWKRLDRPALVEAIRADAGIDIGATLIGMHLRAVAVPVRLSVKTVGAAPITAARTRPKYIGGERARYDEEA